MLRLTMLTAALLIGMQAKAEVLEVAIWDPLPGVSNGAQQSIANAMKVKAIHEKHGAQVSVARDQMGRIHYAMRHDSYAAMTKFYGAAMADEDLAKFWEGANANPTADMVANYMLDVVAPGGNGPIYEVFIWQPLPGMTGAMFEAGMGAKPIHEKAGAKVTILRDRLNRMHYLLNFDSWEDMAKFWDTPNPEFEAYMQKVNQTPSAELVKNYRGFEIQP